MIPCLLLERIKPEHKIISVVMVVLQVSDYSGFWEGNGGKNGDNSDDLRGGVELMDKL